MSVKQVEISKEDDGIRLDRWFSRHYPKVGHGYIEKALRKGQIKVDGKKVKASFRVEEGQVIRVPPLQESDLDTKKPSREINKKSKYIKILRENVIYKDEDVLAINKPHGLAVQGGSGVKDNVDGFLDFLQFESIERPKLVHRLDKDTSGVLLLARKTSIAAKLTEAFRDKNVKKIYWAVVVGVPAKKSGKIDIPIAKRESGQGRQKVQSGDDGQEAVTNYKVLSSANGLSLLEMRPVTGRTHQLRVHALELGTPILCDGKYGGKTSFVDGIDKKLHLHAKKISIPDFIGRKLEVEAELPDHMRKTIEKTGLKG